MKKVLLVVILLVVILVGVVAWKFIFPKKSTNETPNRPGLPVSKHSEDFNESVNRALNDYYALTESFVNWDIAAVNSSLAALKVSVDSMRIPEMERDSAIYETAKITWESLKSDVHGMHLDTSLAERRADLTMLSDNLFNLLRIVKYDVAKVYYHECPMALNNYESSAYWLSSKGDLKSRRNPYLGLHDPKYGKSMLACGATRDSINFSADSTGK
jgi:hypothetical protein